MANSSSMWMCAVIQCDFPNQMDVFRWLQHDEQYRIIYICHDRDICEETHVRVDADGIESTIEQGTLKPEHIHIIIKLPRRLSAETFTKRFGGYVNFQVCVDPPEYARYFTHSTYTSKDKHHYAKSAVRGDLQLYYELMQSQTAKDTLSVVSRIFEYGRECATNQDIVLECINRGDSDALHSIMSHAYFYMQFLDKGGVPF